MRKIILDWYYAFPVQLLVTQLKNNLFLLGLWVLTLLFALGAIGVKTGWLYLFITPEYLGRVDFFSFAIMGLCFASFLVSWNITTYILYSPRFPFLASLKRPFTKYFMNNSIIPLTFLGVLLWKMVDFQWHEECLGAWMIFYNVSGFLFGLFSGLLFTILYFRSTNKDIFSYVGSRQRQRPPNIDKPLLPGQRGVTFASIKAPGYNRVRSYLNESLRWRPVRAVSHYEEKYLLKVFRQNHKNAIVIQTVSVLSLIFLGYMAENPYFRIPASGSYFILMSIITSIAGVISYWLHRWSIPFAIVLVMVLNALVKHNFIDPQNKAMGLSYQHAAPYHSDTLKSLHSPQRQQADKQRTIAILDRWRERQPKSKLRQKPKMVIVCTSGGGLRAAVWTMQVLQQCDKATGGRLMQQTALMTGASGGMFSAAYFRELLLRKRRGENIDLYHQGYLENVGKDILNAVIFTFVTNDIFIPRRQFTHRGQSLPKDRGYAFERELNAHYGHLLDKPLGAYRQPEEEAEIPMMFLSPSIANDGRRIIISPLPVAYMAQPPGSRGESEIGYDAVDFRLLLAENQPDSLRFTAAIRANAAFPYILPNVALPTRPRIELADAGFMDNVGLNSAHRFAQVFSDWIRENTSGLVFLVIRGTNVELEQEEERPGFLKSLANPIRIMQNIVEIQDYEQDNLLGHTRQILGEDFVHFIPFTYQAWKNSPPASISLHLTEQEKIDIINAFYLEQNQQSLHRLKDLMR